MAIVLAMRGAKYLWIKQLRMRALFSGTGERIHQKGNWYWTRSFITLLSYLGVTIYRPLRRCSYHRMFFNRVDSVALRERTFKSVWCATVGLLTILMRVQPRLTSVVIFLPAARLMSSSSPLEQLSSFHSRTTQFMDSGSLPIRE